MKSYSSIIGKNVTDTINVNNAMTESHIVSRNSSRSHEDKEERDDSKSQASHHSGTQILSHQALSMDDDVPKRDSELGSLTRDLFTDANFRMLAAMIVAGGIILGVAVPKNQNLPSPSWQIVSSIIGYTYFLAWSASFYPQIVLNHERRTTRGLSVDFCVLNVLGYVCYTVYTTNFYWNTRIIREYKRLNSAADNDVNGDTRGGEITVQGNDVAFAIHALIMASLTLSQIGIYDSFSARPPSRRVYAVLLFALFFCSSFIGVKWLHTGRIDFLGFLYVLGSIKILVTIGKYVPQVLLNRSRKSTVGWNVWNVILDLTGGVLSFLQLIGDCADMEDWSGITGNPAKIALAIVTICFDLLFLIQHYILYPDINATQPYLALSTEHELGTNEGIS